MTKGDIEGLGLVLIGLLPADLTPSDRIAFDAGIQIIVNVAVDINRIAGAVEHIALRS